MGQRLDVVIERLLELLGVDLDFSINVGRDLFNQITEDLYLGSRPRPQHLSQLKEAKITHVVSCLGNERRPRVTFLEREFYCLFLPVRDEMREDIAWVFPALFDFVAKARKDDHQARILVHCEAGVSRSATFVTALLMQRRQSSFFDAFGHLRAKRQEVLPNLGFATQLQRLELEMGLRRRDDTTISSLARYLKEVCMVPADLETLQKALQRREYDALNAVKDVFGGEIPRVVQGVRRLT